MMGYLASLYLNSPYSAAFEKDVPHLKLAGGGCEQARFAYDANASRFPESKIFNKRLSNGYVVTLSHYQNLVNRYVPQLA